MRWLSVRTGNNSVRPKLYFLAMLRQNRHSPRKAAFAFLYFFFLIRQNV
jgi:hypothetical protein